MGYVLVNIAPRYQLTLTGQNFLASYHSKNLVRLVRTLKKILRTSCMSAESIFVVTPLSIASNAAVGSEIANGCYIDM